MIYPMNIFSSDPATGGIRPFIIFLPQEVKFNIMKSLGYANTVDVLLPKLPFVLPMANGGLIDASSNQYDSVSDAKGVLNQTLGKGVDTLVGGIARAKSATLSGVENGGAMVGRLPDPRLTQVYMGTTQRSFTATWQIIPQSVGEATAAMAILAWVKYCAAPDRASSSKIGVLLQPYVFKIIFSNPLIHLAMQMDQMAIESYSIDYFAQGYASTYSTLMMPKHMSLTMTFKEFGIKTKKDWLPM